jgi:hypothetical protein
MVNKIRTWFRSKILNLEFVQQAINWKQPIEDYLSTPTLDEEEASKKLCRQILKVKDFSKVKKLMAPDERKRYVADASIVYNSPVFKDIINEIQYDQLVFMGLQSDNDRQLMIGRGTINGADLIEERFAKLHAEHIQNLEDSKPIDESNKYDPIIKLDN